LLLLDHFLTAVEMAERPRVLKRLLAPGMPWTVILASSDARLLALCPRVAVLRKGHLVASGAYEIIAQQPELQELLAT
jgi:ABC-type transport system involved in cytochrome bd biosynthesis fused ATPase/permease subunit